ncbi:response regulator [Syntrophobacter fumaroxidans]|uniref:Response regulator receiver protein n=1 Tax=Syntrophobacter fumaroxidans (strain DSM 10017 / MPOB) TaxID=335543 RepID=A0LFW7_SYNFM|nr:response regulator [Syntrophobacter fumaroxidans]ABK16319.1 response regulator receiver protein [Syntrophobacter fumaroxidans MPOB]
MTGKPKVLIVDDEERFRITLRKLLGVQGVEANTAGSAREALEELNNRPYDVVLLDVRMPEISGIEALAEIKKTHRDLEVIILTGHASVDIAVEIMRLGGYEYLLKPCAMDELVAKIESAYERKVAREERRRKAQVSPSDLAS